MMGVNADLDDHDENIINKKLNFLTPQKYKDN